MNKSITRMITLLARKSQSYIGFALSKYNLTAAEQPFFMTLQHHEGITQEELTAIVCVDKAATTRAVKSLEEKGFLVRIQDKEDRRQNRIYSTDAAKQLINSVKSELHNFNSLLTQGIDPESLDLVYSVLMKMEENFTNISNYKSVSIVQGGEKDGESE